jgi:hypothetical protein
MLILNLIIDSTPVEKVNTETSIQKTENSRSNFQEITGTTPEQESNILNTLKDCGIEKVKSVKSEEALDALNENGEKTYSIEYGDLSFLFLYLNPDNTLNLVRYGDNILYKDGNVVSTLSDYTFTWDEQSDLQISCQKAIKSILKSPSTAKFPNISSWSFSKQDGNIIIQGYVDSQNSFGAELRSEFQFILSVNDYIVKSLIFDGEEMISE